MPIFERLPRNQPLGFADRHDAGQRLAQGLAAYAGDPNVVVLGLPRGGVPVAYEVARALGAPLDVFLVRKLGVPGHEELALGAIASGGVRVLNQEVVSALGISPAQLERVARRERAELERREALYRGSRPAPLVAGKVVILVDDGLATGASMRAAVEALRQQGPQKIVVAVPAASPDTCDAFRDLVDDVVCAITPYPFDGVGRWYSDFSQTSDAEVSELLQQTRRAGPAERSRPGQTKNEN